MLKKIKMSKKFKINISCKQKDILKKIRKKKTIGRE